MKYGDTPSIEYIKKYLSYDPLTGSIKWCKTRCGTKLGSEAGTDHKGYRRIKINGKLLLAHRVAWAIYYGEWPEIEIDHINMDKGDNRIENLRDVSRSQNMTNRNYPAGISKISGVNKHKDGWQSVISLNGKRLFLGLFQTIEEAKEARRRAEIEIHREYSPRGNKNE